jgi:hypothetical protein
MNCNAGIMNISIFGSYGRGNPDAFSDLDVLVLCDDGAGTQSEAHVRKLVSDQYEKDPSISWYGKKKLAHFFAIGDLFAWHLHRESFALPGFEPLGKIFGLPAQYLNCLDDIAGLRDILCSIPEQIRLHPQNLIYELGLTYVCMRNIAMTASSVLRDHVDFGRYSPYGLPGVVPSISTNDYGVLARCRHASTRGTPAPSVTIDVEGTLRASLVWAELVERMAR